MNFSGSGNDATARAAADTTSSVPSACPACHSSSITTTAKNPDASSYWRCAGCGEIWNAARRENVRRGPYGWR